MYLWGCDVFYWISRTHPSYWTAFFLYLKCWDWSCVSRHSVRRIVHVCAPPYADLFRRIRGIRGRNCTLLWKLNREVDYVNHGSKSQNIKFAQINTQNNGFYWVDSLAAKPQISHHNDGRSRQIQRVRLVAENRMELDDKRVDNAERGLRQIQVVTLKE